MIIIKTIIVIKVISTETRHVPDDEVVEDGETAMPTVRMPIHLPPNYPMLSVGHSDMLLPSLD